MSTTESSFRHPRLSRRVAIQAGAATSMGVGTAIQMALALTAASALNAVLKPPLIALVRIDGSITILYNNSGTLSIT